MRGRLYVTENATRCGNCASIQFYLPGADAVNPAASPNTILLLIFDGSAGASAQLVVFTNKTKKNGRGLDTCKIHPRTNFQQERPRRCATAGHRGILDTGACADVQIPRETASEGAQHTRRQVSRVLDLGYLFSGTLSSSRSFPGLSAQEESPYVAISFSPRSPRRGRLRFGRARLVVLTARRPRSSPSPLSLTVAQVCDWWGILAPCPHCNFHPYPVAHDSQHNNHCPRERRTTTRRRRNTGGPQHVHSSWTHWGTLLLRYLGGYGHAGRV